MFYYLFIIFATVTILCYLIGLYYFLKKNYDNFFVNLTIGKNNLILLKSNQINQQNHKKIKVILTISTILVIILYLLMLYIFKSYYDIVKVSVIVLMYLVILISNKYIQKITGV